MQLNKVLKGLMLALPMLAVAACSSKKGNDKTGTENNVADSNASLSAEQLAFLRGNPSVKITVEGHADEKGTPEYNIALGERRANAVKMYLQSKGVNGEQIAIVSYGKEKPAVLGHDESAYAKNRRAVLAY